MVRIMNFFESFNLGLKKNYICGIITTDPQTLKSRNNLKKDIKMEVCHTSNPALILIPDISGFTKYIATYFYSRLHSN